MLTREQAIEIAGQSTIDRLDNENCAPTCRCGYRGHEYGDETTEWKSTTYFQDGAEENFISALYYTDKEQDKILAETGDGASIDWVIAGYTVDF